MTDADDITQALLAGTLGIAEHGLAVAGVEPAPDEHPLPPWTEAYMGMVWRGGRMYDRDGTELLGCREEGEHRYDGINRQSPRQMVLLPPRPGCRFCGRPIHQVRAERGHHECFDCVLLVAETHGPGLWSRLPRHRGHIDDEGAWRPRRLRPGGLFMDAIREEFNAAIERRYQASLAAMLTTPPTPAEKTP